MDHFPLTLPMPEGYDPKRDFYPAHDHDHYRWAMVVDLDRCIGCGACVAACYAENNVGIVGEKLITQGREMAWLEIVRYHDERRMQRLMFLPMLCQHCDNAPCESVCPVYAPHHSAEGLNNQIYNRWHRHAILLPELPLQGAAVQLVHLGMAGASEPAAKSRCNRTQQRGDGKVLLLHPAHQGGTHPSEE